MRLLLSQIRTEDGTFSRAKINHSVVVEYARAISNGHHFPPIVVFFDGNCYFLASSAIRPTPNLTAKKIQSKLAWDEEKTRKNEIWSPYFE